MKSVIFDTPYLLQSGRSYSSEIRNPTTYVSLFMT